MNTSEILQLIQTLKDTGFKHIDVSHEGSHVLLSNAEYAGATMGSNPHYAVPVHNQHSFSEGVHHQTQYHHRLLQQNARQGFPYHLSRSGGQAGVSAAAGARHPHGHRLQCLECAG